MGLATVEIQTIIYVVLGSAELLFLIVVLSFCFILRYIARTRREIKFPLKNLSSEHFSKKRWKKIERKIDESVNLNLDPPENLLSDQNQKSWESDTFNRKHFVRNSCVVLEDIASLRKDLQFEREPSQTIKEFSMILKDQINPHSKKFNIFLEKYEKARFSRNKVSKKEFQNFVGKFGDLLTEMNKGEDDDL